jgi:hypothetical protein
LRLAFASAAITWAITPAFRFRKERRDFIIGDTAIGRLLAARSVVFIDPVGAFRTLSLALRGNCLEK